MNPAEEEVSLTGEDRHQSLKRPQQYGSKAETEISLKGIVTQLVDNLDKVLALLLVFLLLLFFLQSSGTAPAKKTITKEALLSIDLPPATTEPIQSTIAKPKKQHEKTTPTRQREQDAEEVTLKTLMHENQGSSGEDDDLGKKVGLKKSQSKKKKEQLERILDDENIESIFDPDAPKKPSLPEAESTISEPAQSPADSLQQLKYLPHRRRSEFFKQKQRVDHLEYLKLAKFNLIAPDIDEEQREILLQEQRERLEKKYKLSEFQQELSICVVVHASGHKKSYAHEYLLNSILSQDYEHYSVVYIADGFTAEQAQPVRQFIKKRDRDRRVSFVWNSEKKYFLESTVTAVKAFCMEKRVTVLVDGEDELLGTQVFKVLNTFYRRHAANLVYGNFVEFHEAQQQLRIGFATQYEDVEKRDNTYRSIGQKFGSIKSFKTRLISFIKQSDLRDSFGSFYRYAGDYALMYPLLQLSCGQVRYMPEYNYLYFGYEIDPTYGSLQIANGRAIRERPRYECFKKYK